MNSEMDPNGPEIAQIAKILGLPPNVLSFTLRVGFNSPVEVDCTYHPSQNAAETLYVNFKGGEEQSRVHSIDMRDLIDRNLRDGRIT